MTLLCCLLCILGFNTAIKYDINNGSDIATKSEVAGHCISLKTAGDGSVDFGVGSNKNFCLA